MKELIKKPLQVFNRLFYRVNWHNLRSLTPVSSRFGYDRGTPIDRVYIEDFLEKNKNLITGSVLEIAEDTYSRRFGHDVSHYGVLNFTKDKKATIVGDLTKMETLPAGQIDCFICTQTLNFIYDFKAAIRGIHYLLKDKGTALVTVSGLTQISRYDMDRWGDYWRFNTLSAKKMFAEVFGENNVEIDYYGNVLAASALLQGISAEELSSKELMFKDSNYQIIISIKAKK
jgi:hypothetical protein